METGEANVLPMQDVQADLMVDDDQVQIIHEVPDLEPSWQDLVLNYSSGALIAVGVGAGLMVFVLIIVCSIYCHYRRLKSSEEDKLLQAASQKETDGKKPLPDSDAKPLTDIKHQEAATAGEQTDTDTTTDTATTDTGTDVTDMTLREPAHSQSRRTDEPAAYENFPPESHPLLDSDPQYWLYGKHSDGRLDRFGQETPPPPHPDYQVPARMCHSQPYSSTQVIHSQTEYPQDRDVVELSLPPEEAEEPEQYWESRDAHRMSTVAQHSGSPRTSMLQLTMPQSPPPSQPSSPRPPFYHPAMPPPPLRPLPYSVQHPPPPPPSPPPPHSSSYHRPRPLGTRESRGSFVVEQADKSSRYPPHLPREARQLSRTSAPTLTYGDSPDEPGTRKPSSMKKTMQNRASSPAVFFRPQQSDSRLHQTHAPPLAPQPSQEHEQFHPHAPLQFYHEQEMQQLPSGYPDLPQVLDSKLHKSVSFPSVSSEGQGDRAARKQSAPPVLKDVAHNLQSQARTPSGLSFHGDHSQTKHEHLSKRASREAEALRIPCRKESSSGYDTHIRGIESSGAVRQSYAAPQTHSSHQYELQPSMQPQHIQGSQHSNLGQSGERGVSLRDMEGKSLVSSDSHPANQDVEASRVLLDRDRSQTEMPQYSASGKIKADPCLSRGNFIPGNGNSDQHLQQRGSVPSRSSLISHDANYASREFSGEQNTKLATYNSSLQTEDQYLQHRFSVPSKSSLISQDANYASRDFSGDQNTVSAVHTKPSQTEHHHLQHRVSAPSKNSLISQDANYASRDFSVDPNTKFAVSDSPSRTEPQHIQHRVSVPSKSSLILQDTNYASRNFSGDQISKSAVWDTPSRTEHQHIQQRVSVPSNSFLMSQDPRDFSGDPNTKPATYNSPSQTRDVGRADHSDVENSTHAQRFDAPTASQQHFGEMAAHASGSDRDPCLVENEPVSVQYSNNETKAPSSFYCDEFISQCSAVPHHSEKAQKRSTQHTSRSSMSLKEGKEGTLLEPGRHNHSMLSQISNTDTYPCPGCTEAYDETTHVVNQDSRNSRHQGDHCTSQSAATLPGETFGLQSHIHPQSSRTDPFLLCHSCSVPRCSGSPFPEPPTYADSQSRTKLNHPPQAGLTQESDRDSLCVVCDTSAAPNREDSHFVDHGSASEQHRDDERFVTHSSASQQCNRDLHMVHHESHTDQHLVKRNSAVQQYIDTPPISQQPHVDPHLVKRDSAGQQYSNMPTSVAQKCRRDSHLLKRHSAGQQYKNDPPNSFDQQSLVDPRLVKSSSAFQKYSDDPNVQPPSSVIRQSQTDARLSTCTPDCQQHSRVPFAVAPTSVQQSSTDPCLVWRNSSSTQNGRDPRFVRRHSVPSKYSNDSSPTAQHPREAQFIKTENQCFSSHSHLAPQHNADQQLSSETSVPAQHSSAGQHPPSCGRDLSKCSLHQYTLTQGPLKSQYNQNVASDEPVMSQCSMGQHPTSHSSMTSQYKTDQSSTMSSHYITDQSSTSHGPVTSHHNVDKRRTSQDSMCSQGQHMSTTEHPAPPHQENGRVMTSDSQHCSKNSRLAEHDLQIQKHRGESCFKETYSVGQQFDGQGMMLPNTISPQSKSVQTYLNLYSSVSPEGTRQVEESCIQSYRTSHSAGNVKSKPQYPQASVISQQKRNYQCQTPQDFEDIGSSVQEHFRSEKQRVVKRDACVDTASRSSSVSVKIEEDSCLSAEASFAPEGSVAVHVCVSPTISQSHGQFRTIPQRSSYSSTLPHQSSRGRTLPQQSLQSYPEPQHYQTTRSKMQQVQQIQSPHRYVARSVLTSSSSTVINSASLASYAPRVSFAPQTYPNYQHYAAASDPSIVPRTTTSGSKVSRHTGKEKVTSHGGNYFKQTPSNYSFEVSMGGLQEFPSKSGVRLDGGLEINATVGKEIPGSQMFEISSVQEETTSKESVMSKHVDGSFSEKETNHYRKNVTRHNPSRKSSSGSTQMDSRQNSLIAVDIQHPVSDPLNEQTRGSGNTTTTVPERPQRRCDQLIGNEPATSYRREARTIPDLPSEIPDTDSPTPPPRPRRSCDKKCGQVIVKKSGSLSSCEEHAQESADYFNEYRGPQYSGERFKQAQIAEVTNHRIETQSRREHEVQLQSGRGGSSRHSRNTGWEANSPNRYNRRTSSRGDEGAHHNGQAWTNHTTSDGFREGDRQNNFPRQSDGKAETDYRRSAPECGHEHQSVCTHSQYSRAEGDQSHHANTVDAVHYMRSQPPRKQPMKREGSPAPKGQSGHAHHYPPCPNPNPATQRPSSGHQGKRESLARSPYFYPNEEQVYKANKRYAKSAQHYNKLPFPQYPYYPHSPPSNSSGKNHRQNQPRHGSDCARKQTHGQRNSGKHGPHLEQSEKTAERKRTDSKVGIDQGKAEWNYRRVVERKVSGLRKTYVNLSHSWTRQTSPTLQASSKHPIILSPYPAGQSHADDKSRTIRHNQQSEYPSHYTRSNSRTTNDRTRGDYLSQSENHSPKYRHHNHTPIYYSRSPASVDNSTSPSSPRKRHAQDRRVSYTKEEEWDYKQPTEWKVSKLRRTFSDLAKSQETSPTPTHENQHSSCKGTRKLAYPEVGPSGPVSNVPEHHRENVKDLRRKYSDQSRRFTRIPFPEWPQHPRPRSPSSSPSVHASPPPPPPAPIRFHGRRQDPDAVEAPCSCENLAGKVSQLRSVYDRRIKKWDKVPVPEYPYYPSSRSPSPSQSRWSDKRAGSVNAGASDGEWDESLSPRGKVSHLRRLFNVPSAQTRRCYFRQDPCSRSPSSERNVDITGSPSKNWHADGGMQFPRGTPPCYRRSASPSPKATKHGLTKHGYPFIAARPSQKTTKPDLSKHHYPFGPESPPPRTTKPDLSRHHYPFGLESPPHLQTTKPDLSRHQYPFGLESPPHTQTTKPDLSKHHYPFISASPPPQTTKPDLSKHHYPFGLESPPPPQTTKPDLSKHNFHFVSASPPAQTTKPDLSRHHYPFVSPIGKSPPQTAHKGKRELYGHHCPPAASSPQLSPERRCEFTHHHYPYSPQPRYQPRFHHSDHAIRPMRHCPNSPSMERSHYVPSTQEFYHEGRRMPADNRRVAKVQNFLQRRPRNESRLPYPRYPYYPCTPPSSPPVTKHVGDFHDYAEPQQEEWDYKNHSDGTVFALKKQFSNQARLNKKSFVPVFRGPPSSRTFEKQCKAETMSSTGIVYNARQETVHQESQNCINVAAIRNEFTKKGVRLSGRFIPARTESTHHVREILKNGEIKDMKRTSIAENRGFAKAQVSVTERLPQEHDERHHSFRASNRDLLLDQSEGRQANPSRQLLDEDPMTRRHSSNVETVVERRLSHRGSSARGMNEESGAAHRHSNAAEYLKQSHSRQASFSHRQSLGEIPMDAKQSHHGRDQLHRQPSNAYRFSADQGRSDLRQLSSPRHSQEAHVQVHPQHPPPLSTKGSNSKPEPFRRRSTLREHELAPRRHTTLKEEQDRHPGRPVTAVDSRRHSQGSVDRTYSDPRKSGHDQETLASRGADSRAHLSKRHSSSARHPDIRHFEDSRAPEPYYGNGGHDQHRSTEKLNRSISGEKADASRTVSLSRRRSSAQGEFRESPSASRRSSQFLAFDANESNIR